jgi:ADP-ribosylglycohydrolase
LDAGTALALRSLEGLSLGDAFGERFFDPALIPFIDERRLPAPPWFWTDDTEMALSIVAELREHGRIDPDSLARRFVERYDPARGHGGGAVRWMREVGSGVHWTTAARSLFKGSGSCGNGAAMRVAPLGAFFKGDCERSLSEARLSAEVTHAHPEGRLGAQAVALAATLVAGSDALRGSRLLAEVARLLPEGETKEGIRRAADLDPAFVGDAARELGSGYRVLAQDTVPFALFCAAHHLGDFEGALWATVSQLGDRDTTCAIVGGLVALSVEVLPQAWLEAREPLPRLWDD